MEHSQWNKNWYAIHVRPRSEIATANMLQGKGFEPFVPLYKSRRTWSDRKVYLFLPLFPGYIFCPFDLRMRLPIITTPNILGIVGTGKVPLPIEVSEIEAIQRIVQCGYAVESHAFLNVGTKVVIESGPLAGLRGIVKTYKNRRLILSIGIIQQSICVDCAEDILIIISPTEPFDGDTANMTRASGPACSEPKWSAVSSRRKED
jgi:transcription antitermination factor NusG